MEMWGYIFKVLLKFNIAATDYFHFCRRKTLKYLKSEIIQFLQSHFPHYGDVQVILLNFTIATTRRLFNYL